VAPHRLGIDIGGSSAKVSLLDAASHVLANTAHELPDVADDPVANRAARIGLVATTTHRVLDEHGSDLSVGIASPGIVDAGHRRVVALPGKLAGLEGIDWNESLRHRAALPRPLPRISVLNDAHAAVLGEVRLGAGRGLGNVAMLTLGTGVGGGVVLGGELFEGPNRRAGHLGHISLDPYGAASVFPTPGSLEWHVGAAYVAERTAGRFTAMEALVDAVRAGEGAAAAEWRRLVRALAVGIASIVHAFDPERVILGGGLVAVGALLFEPLARELDEVEWRPNGLTVPVVPAELGRFSGSIGAAVFGHERSMS
jgi:glucokinase